MENKVVFYMKIFLTGCFTFFISQVVLRIPLINVVGKNSTVARLSIIYPVIYAILISWSAGLFEELFRYLFGKFLIKNKNLISGILFGLGHGIFEVLYILYLSKDTFYMIDFRFFTLERIIAITFHIGMAVLIFYSLSKNKDFLGVILAIFLHGLYNFQIFTFKNIYVLYVVYILISILIIYILYRLKRGKIL